MCALATAGIALLLVASPASAHEFRKVGKYGLVVGFGTEPAYAGQPNRVQLLVSDAATNEPVADIGNDLKVQVIFGDQSQDLEMEPEFEVHEFGTVGDYGADFIPTRPGKYTFHFTGSIKGQKIDESFTSGPDTFGEVEDPVAAEFPVKDPTTGQLNEKIDREIPRLTSGIGDANDAADGAKTLSYVSLAVGGLGLVVGLIALARGGRRT